MFGGKRIKNFEEMTSASLWERTFEGRRLTLMKKAKELELCCGVRVTVTIKSHSQIYFYSSNPNTTKLLELSGLVKKNSINMESTLNVNSIEEIKSLTEIPGSSNSFSNCTTTLTSIATSTSTAISTASTASSKTKSPRSSFARIVGSSVPARKQIESVQRPLLSVSPSVPSITLVLPDQKQTQISSSDDSSEDSSSTESSDDSSSDSSSSDDSSSSSLSDSRSSSCSPFDSRSNGTKNNTARMPTACKNISSTSVPYKKTNTKTDTFITKTNSSIKNETGQSKASLKPRNMYEKFFKDALSKASVDKPVVYESSKPKSNSDLVRNPGSNSMSKTALIPINTSTTIKSYSNVSNDNRKLAATKKSKAKVPVTKNTLASIKKKSKPKLRKLKQLLDKRQALSSEVIGECNSTKTKNFNQSGSATEDVKKPEEKSPSIALNQQVSNAIAKAKPEAVILRGGPSNKAGNSPLKANKKPNVSCEAGRHSVKTPKGVLPVNFSKNLSNRSGREILYNHKTEKELTNALFAAAALKSENDSKEEEEKNKSITSDNKNVKQSGSIKCDAVPASKPHNPSSNVPENSSSIPELRILNVFSDSDKAIASDKNNFSSKADTLSCKGKNATFKNNSRSVPSREGLEMKIDTTDSQKVTTIKEESSLEWSISWPPDELETMLTDPASAANPSATELQPNKVEDAKPFVKSVLERVAQENSNESPEGKPFSPNKNNMLRAAILEPKDSANVLRKQPTNSKQILQKENYSAPVVKIEPYVWDKAADFHANNKVIKVEKLSEVQPSVKATEQRPLPADGIPKKPFMDNCRRYTGRFRCSNPSSPPRLRMLKDDFDRNMNLVKTPFHKSYAGSASKEKFCRGLNSTPYIAVGAKRFLNRDLVLSDLSNPIRTSSDSVKGRKLKSSAKRKNIENCQSHVAKIPRSQNCAKNKKKQKGKLKQKRWYSKKKKVATR